MSVVGGEDVVRFAKCSKRRRRIRSVSFSSITVFCDDARTWLTSLLRFFNIRELFSILLKNKKKNEI